MKLKNGWRRWTTPTTIKKKQDHFVCPPVNRNSLPVTAIRDWQVHRGHGYNSTTKEDRELRKEKLVGEAKEIVGAKKDKIIDLSKRRKEKSFGDGTVIERLSQMIEDLDRAIEVKQHDLEVEGTTQAPENHYKLGILRAADSMLRRTRAALEDYGTDLAHDIDSSLDVEEAAKGEDLEKDWPIKSCDHDFGSDVICSRCGTHEDDLDEDEDEDE